MSFSLNLNSFLHDFMKWFILPAMTAAICVRGRNREINAQRHSSHPCNSLTENKQTTCSTLEKFQSYYTILYCFTLSNCWYFCIYSNTMPGNSSFLTYKKLTSLQIPCVLVYHSVKFSMQLYWTVDLLETY